MAEQKIFPQQITVTGSTNGQVLTANTTSNTAYWAPANSWLTTVTSKNIIPAAANTYSLGSPTRRFKDLFLSGATMYLGNTTLSSTKKGALTIQAQGSATVQTLVSNSYLTSVYIANTTARTLISDRLQVANAVATYLTKTNPVVSGTLSANGSTGTAGYYLRTSGTGVYWSPVAASSSGATWAALTGTNTALRTLISDRYQVANVNTLLLAKASWVGLTGTNTAIRTLVSDRLQVANAASVYQTKAIERAALANTNLRINLINTNLTGTNTALRTLVSDRYQVANVNTLLAAKATWTSLTTTNTALRTLISDRLQVANASTIYLTKNNPVITGTLTANSSTGTAGYYLRTSGAGIYWSPVAAGGGGTFTGGTVTGATTFSSGVTLSSTLSAAGSTGTAGQVLVSAGSSASSYWAATIPVSAYSVQLAGAQSLNPPSGTTWQFAGNFTIECWLYRTGTGDQSVVVQNSGANYFAFNVNAGTGFNIYLNAASVSFAPTDIVPLTNRWNHIALVRNGSTVSVYLNGVASATTSTNSSTIGYNLPFYIGCLGTQATGGTIGFISNLRVSTAAVYTGTFTPPTSPLGTAQAAGTNISALTPSQVSLLTCNGPGFTDSSPNAFVITNNGNVVATQFAPFSSFSAIAKSATQTQTILTSGSGTYYTPSGVAWLRVRMVGGGGGAGGGSVSSSYAGAGSAGSNTTFGTSFLTATAGSGADNSNAPGLGGGAGGAGTITGATGITIAGGRGSPGGFSPYSVGGSGGSTPFGGVGVGFPPGSVGNGTAGSTNSGSGGGAGGGPGAGYSFAGHGGGGGGYVEAYISNPAASYAYTVGTGGGGGAGSTGGNGGSGGSGVIIVEENYAVSVVKKSMTQTILTSGSGTYTTPIGVVQLEIRMVGGGAGGTAGGGGTVGSAGTNTTFGTSFLNAGGGSASPGQSAYGGGPGGTSSGGNINLNGGSGAAGTASYSSAQGVGAVGGSSAFGGGGYAGGAYSNVNGGAAGTNTGGGGGGGAVNSQGGWGGGGGGAGGYVEAYISTPAASYSYTVGAGGGGGASGATTGGGGGSGIIIIKEYY